MIVSAERLFSVAYNNEKGFDKYTNGFESLTIKDLNYSYGEKQVLKKVNLTVNKGDKILIKGVSGEGKTTFLKALTGLYNDYDGEVYLTVNGNKITPYNIKGAYAYVPQDNMLFSGTILENITFNNSYNFDKILEVLSLCNIDFISHNKVGLNTYIGENGLNLSTGQGQRIAMARGIIKGAPILILDEATSSLDDKTEEEILSKIASISDLTVIFVSHKTCFEKYASKIYNLKGGELFTTFNDSKNENA
jgi:ABC-type bacteriocin/lantibiotic exporter with double-glycine peptidase domain